MKLITKSNFLKLIIIAAVSLTGLSLTASSAYHKELGKHKENVSAITQNIIKQHRNIDKSTVSQAKAEHDDIESSTKAKLADAKKIKNHKDRERAISQIKDARDRMHKDVNARKRARLEQSHQLKVHNLKTTRDRYKSIENGIRTKHGRAIKTTKSTRSSATKTANTTSTANKRTKTNRKARPARRPKNVTSNPTTTVTHTTKTKSAQRKARAKRRANNSKNGSVNYGTVLNN